MKVVYVHCSCMAQWGSSKALKTMLTGLTQCGVEPLVVLPGRGELSEVLEQMSVPTLSLNYRLAIYPKKNSLWDKILFFPRLIYWQWLNIVASWKLVRILKGSDISLIHTNVGVVDIGYRASRRLGIPHIYHIREYADVDFNMHYFPTKDSFRRQLAVPSSYSICITKDIQRHHGQAEAPFSRVVYDAIRPQLSICPSSSFGNFLLFAGRLEYTKGLDLLLQAYALCRQRGQKLLPLWVAGQVTELSYGKHMEMMVKNHQLDVHFLGERSDIESLMSQARALVVPSRHEGFGLCMPEAMFNRCLVIAHDTAGTHEQLETGLHLAGDEIALRFLTIEQLADRIAEVSTAASDAYSDMTIRAFNAVNQLYTTEKHIAQVYQFYKDILNN